MAQFYVVDNSRNVWLGGRHDTKKEAQKARKAWVEGLPKAEADAWTIEKR